MKKKDCLQDGIMSIKVHKDWISTRQCKTTFCTYYKGITVEEGGIELACLQYDLYQTEKNISKIIKNTRLYPV